MTKVSTTEETAMDPLVAPSAPDSPPHVVDIPALVRRTQHLLEAGVPLTLLIDLVDERGPRSVLLYEAEGGDTAWLEQPTGA